MISLILSKRSASWLILRRMDWCWLNCEPRRLLRIGSGRRYSTRLSACLTAVEASAILNVRIRPVRCSGGGRIGNGHVGGRSRGGGHIVERYGGKKSQTAGGKGATAGG
ncbi:hypothetical protein KCU76_g46, partial [Aureobasidium melanogenum]